tara:strand:- start:95 stop:277 length:183 start_codon:yes stop_codon:yes gene_type:complete
MTFYNNDDIYNDITKEVDELHNKIDKLTKLVEKISSEKNSQTQSRDISIGSTEDPLLVEM